MTPIMKRTEKDDAVSPVVGVMLMLVVTIIIAAVVAAFSTGMVSTVEKAPFAALDVKMFSGNDGIIKDVYIDHLSGDALYTGDLKIKFTWKGGSNEYSGGVSSLVSDDPDRYGHTHALFRNADGDDDVNGFGTVTLTNGFRLQSLDTSAKSGMKTLFGESSYDTIKTGTPVKVIITHTPSGQIIYEKEVIVA